MPACANSDVFAWPTQVAVLIACEAWVALPEPLPPAAAARQPLAAPVVDGLPVACESVAPASGGDGPGAACESVALASGGDGPAGDNAADSTPDPSTTGRSNHNGSTPMHWCCHSSLHTRKAIVPSVQ
jgi:hypothetical protein